MRHENLSVGELTLGRGSVISATLTPASVGSATVATQASFSVPGVSATDVLTCVNTPISNATAVVKAVATAADTVSLTFVNPTAGALTPTTGAYKFLVIKTQ